MKHSISLLISFIHAYAWECDTLRQAFYYAACGHRQRYAYLYQLGMQNTFLVENPFFLIVNSMHRLSQIRRLTEFYAVL